MQVVNVLHGLHAPFLCSVASWRVFAGLAGWHVTIFGRAGSSTPSPPFGTRVCRKVSLPEFLRIGSSEGGAASDALRLGVTDVVAAVSFAVPGPLETLWAHRVRVLGMAWRADACL